MNFLRITKQCHAAALVVALSAAGTHAHAHEPNVVLQYNSEIHTQSPEGSAHMVARGETLFGILRRYFGPNADLPSLARETVQRNPAAFRNGDMERMLAGQRLVLPDASHSPNDPDDIYFF